MGVTGMANLAVKVADLDAACAWYREAGASVTEPVQWENGRRSDVTLGPVERDRCAPNSSTAAISAPKTASSRISVIGTEVHSD